MYNFTNKKLLNFSFFAIVVLIATLAVSSFALGQVPPGPQPPVPPGDPYVAGEVLVNVKDGTPEAAFDGLMRALGAVPTVATAQLEKLGVRMLNVAPGREVTVAEALSRSPLVDFAEPNYIYQLHSPPSDPDFGVQWALNNTGQSGGTADADVDWLEAYEGFSSFTSTIIAVIDTGIDQNHRDLADKIVAIVDFIGGNGDDTYGHGTHVSGIAAAVTNNTVDADGDGNLDGVAGVAFSDAITIMSIRAGDENGLPSGAIASGIRHAADNGAKVINMSFGGYFRSRTIQKAVDYAWKKGLVLVASAGNDSVSWRMYPAAYDKVMAVSATDDTDHWAYYSNYGNWLSVAAPGGEMSDYHDVSGIYSTMPTDDVYLTTQYFYSKYYDYLQGTSMAAPHVAGLGALLFAQDATRTNSDVRSIIEATTDDLGPAGFDADYGHGRINVYNALNYSAPPPPPPPPSGGKMYVWNIAWKYKKNLDITVTIQWDSNNSGTADEGDSPVEGAGVWMTLQGPGGPWDFNGLTNSGGDVKFKLIRAEGGDYTATVTNVTHSDYEWDSTLDADNSDTFDTSQGSEAAPALVRATGLGNAFPSPGNPEIWIPFTLSEAEHVVIKIYNMTGGLVRTLDLGQKAPSAYVSKGKAAYWDGRNESGEKVTSGIYFYLMEAGSFRAMKKMVILK